MSKIIYLDTETTGFSPKKGDRMVEIGALIFTGGELSSQFHSYLNPMTPVHPGALKVHGLTNEFLADYPTFAEIAGEFLEFISGGELVIHNAPFDLSFLDFELGLADLPTVTSLNLKVVDTLPLAKELVTGKHNLSDLCDTLSVKKEEKMHSAIADCLVLQRVHKALSLLGEKPAPKPSSGIVGAVSSALRIKPRPK